MAGSGYSSYAEYKVAPANTVMRLPPNINFEQGTSLLITFGTAAVCLFKKGGVREPECASHPAPTYASGEVYIIAGAATSLSAYAIQFAKLCGLRSDRHCRQQHGARERVVPRRGDRLQRKDTRGAR